MFKSVLNLNSCNCRRECRPKSFGEVHDNYNWVECPSGKNPNQFYYFNVRSQCTTWTRPVPEHVNLPFFNPHAVPPQKNDDYETSPPVSDLDDDLYEDNENDQYYVENNDEEQFFDIASKLFYHGSRNARKSRRKREDNSEASKTLPLSDFLELEYLSADNLKRLRSRSSSTETLKSHDSFQNSSNESCKCSVCQSQKSSSNCRSSSSYHSARSGFSAPRLKPITYADLVTEPKKKLRRQKRRKIESPNDAKKGKLTPDKRVYDMYGVRTINFDPVFEFINPVIQSGDEPSCLTDSSIQSPIPEKKTFKDIRLRIKNPVLSEQSSGSDAEEPVPAKNIKETATNVYKDILEGKQLYVNLLRIDVNKELIKLKNKNTRKEKENSESEWEEYYSEEDDSKDETFSLGNSTKCFTRKQCFSDKLRKDVKSYDENMEESFAESEESKAVKDEWFIVKHSLPTKISLRKVANGNSVINSEEAAPKIAIENNNQSPTNDFEENSAVKESPVPLKIKLEIRAKNDEGKFKKVSKNLYSVFQNVLESFQEKDPEKSIAVYNNDESSIRFSPPALKLRLIKKDSPLKDFEGANNKNESLQKENSEDSTSDSDDSTDSSTDSTDSSESSQEKGNSDSSTTDFEGGEIQKEFWQRNGLKNSTKAVESPKKLAGNNLQSFPQKDKENLTAGIVIYDSITNFEKGETEPLIETTLENSAADDNYWSEFFQQIDLGTLADEKIINESWMDCEVPEAQFFQENVLVNPTSENVVDHFEGDKIEETVSEKPADDHDLVQENIENLEAPNFEESKIEEESLQNIASESSVADENYWSEFFQKIDLVNTMAEEILKEDSSEKPIERNIEDPNPDFEKEVQEYLQKNVLEIETVDNSTKDLENLVEESFQENSATDRNSLSFLNSTSIDRIQESIIDCKEKSNNVHLFEPYGNSLTTTKIIVDEILTSFINCEEVETEKSFKKESSDNLTCVNNEEDKSVKANSDLVKVSEILTVEINNKESPVDSGEIQTIVNSFETIENSFSPRKLMFEEITTSLINSEKAKSPKSVEKQFSGDLVYDSDDLTEKLENISQNSSYMNGSLTDLEEETFEKKVPENSTVTVNNSFEQKSLRTDKDSDGSLTESLHTKNSKDLTDESILNNSTKSRISKFFEGVTSSSPINCSIIIEGECQNKEKSKEENEDLSDAETCSTVALSRSRKGDITDEELTDIEEQLNLLETEIDLNDGKFRENSDTTYICSHLDLE